MNDKKFLSSIFFFGGGLVSLNVLEENSKLNSSWYIDNSIKDIEKFFFKRKRPVKKN